MRLSTTLPPSLQGHLAQLGARIRLARKQQRLTLAAMEALTGIHRTTLGRLEYGDQGVGIGALITVLAALGQAHEIEFILGSAHSHGNNMEIPPHA